MSRCHAIGRPCEINQYYKDSSNIDECQLVCENEAACTGFLIDYWNKCYIYGNISSVNVDSWANPDAWTHSKKSPKFTFGYEGFKVNTYDVSLPPPPPIPPPPGSELTRTTSPPPGPTPPPPGFHCFKRLDEGGSNDGKFLNYLWLQVACNIKKAKSLTFTYEKLNFVSKC